MFKKVAGENKVDRSALEKFEFGDARNVSFDSGLQAPRETWPLIQRDAPPGLHIVDEMPVSCPQFEHTSICGNH